MKLVLSQVQVQDWYSLKVEPSVQVQVQVLVRVLLLVLLLSPFMKVI
jgi:hypothetical protein